MKTWEYKTKQNDTWDIVARNVYGTESLAGTIQQANPAYLSYVYFPAGLVLTIPPTPASATASTVAPWKRGGLLSQVPNPVGQILLDTGILIPPESATSGATGDHTHNTDQVYEGEIRLTDSLLKIRTQLNSKLEKNEVDARYANKTHADQHAIGGSDRIRPDDIGAVSWPQNDGKTYVLSGSGLVEHIDGEGSGEDGTMDHAKLENRDAVNQHPQSAIQYLSEDLQAIRNDIDDVDQKARTAMDEVGHKVDAATMDEALGNKASVSHAGSHRTGGDDPITPESIGALALPTDDGKFLITREGYEEFTGGSNGPDVASQDEVNGGTIDDKYVSPKTLKGRLASTESALAAKAEAAEVTAALATKANQSDVTAALAGKAEADHASRHAAGGADAITPASIGAVAANDSRLTDARTPTSHAATHGTGGADAITPAAIGAVANNDSRLTDARTPTKHAASHASGGADAITPANIGAATSTEITAALNAKITYGTTDLIAGTSTLATGAIYLVYE